jgi:integrase/recombinase XerD
MKDFRERYRSGQFALTAGQVEQFLRVVSDLRDLAFFQLVLSIGLRRDDSVNIKKADINLTDKTLCFYEKKKKKIRVVYLNDKVLNTIQMVFNAYPKDRDKRMFPISSKTAYNRFQMYLMRAGLGKRPFHSLRATAIKLCQAKGWSIEQTAELVGDRIDTIQAHYLTPSKEEMRAVSTDKAII